MNISRIALLSAALFIAPFALASEPSVITKDLAKTTGFFTKAGNLVVAPFTSVATLAGKIADKSYLNAAISKITGISYFQNTVANKPESIQTIGKTIVIAAAAVALYKAYTMYNAQDIDNDDDIFGDDENYEINN